MSAKSKIETNCEIAVTIPAMFEPGNARPTSMRMVERIGTMQDPNIAGDAGLIEIMAWFGGYGFQLWHADGRKIDVPLAAVCEAACKTLLAQPVTEAA